MVRNRVNVLSLNDPSIEPILSGCFPVSNAHERFKGITVISKRLESFSSDLVNIPAAISNFLLFVGSGCVQ